MFGTILQRTILLELLRVFVMSLVGITGILLIAGIIAEASQHGLGPLQILAVIPLLIPSTLPYTLPATTLFATCVVYGRLSNDNEILAIKAAGGNILHVVSPALLLGLTMTGATLFLYYDVIPYTHHLMRTMFLGDIEELLYAMLKRDNMIRHPNMNCEMKVDRVQGKRLLDAVFMRFDPKNGIYDVVARAKEAKLRVDLKQNQLLVHMLQCEIVGSSLGVISEKVFPVDLPRDLSPSKLRATDMTWDEIWEKLAGVRKELEAVEADIALVVTQLSMAHPPEDLAQHLKNLHYVRQQKRSEINGLIVELHMRPALSLGCLCFVLLGCPVGIWFSRSDYLSAFISCFLPIVFLYYPLMLCGINLAKNGRVSPAISVWAADSAMGLIAFFLFRKLLRN